MSRKKKGLALWLALFLGVSSLTGCGSGNDNMTQLSQKGGTGYRCRTIKNKDAASGGWDYHPGADGDHCGKR